MPLNFQRKPTHRLLVTAIFARIGTGPAVDGRHSGSRLVSNGNHKVPPKSWNPKESRRKKGYTYLEGKGNGEEREGKEKGRTHPYILRTERAIMRRGQRRGYLTRVEVNRENL